MQGRWRCENRGCIHRVAAVIDAMFEMTDVNHIRPASLGRDLFRHEFPEGNERATPIAIRGAFDGGVCLLGSGCGFRLHMGMLNRECVSEKLGFVQPRPVGPFPPGHELSFTTATPLVWRDVAEAAWLPEGVTIAECELSAAEALLCAAR
eukprot:2783143-Pyramimonas_sp.AAC.1